jgi:hypothetical protein
VDDANLEHVFPINPSTDWKNVAELEPYKWHIGNLTVLSTRLNRDAANSGFAKKQTYYTQSELKLTQELTKSTDWNKAEVLKRASALASIVTKNWTGP